jgi:signal transduction histidine kinase
MTDHTAPQSDPCQPSTAVLQRLAQFARDLGHPTSLPVIAERILSGLSEVSRHSHGILYLLDRERERFFQVVLPAPNPLTATPPVLPLTHPLVQQLADHRQILDSSAATSLDNLTDARFRALPIDLAVPLLTLGKLIGFVLFPSPIETAVIPSPVKELLAAMAQSAANAIDSFLRYEDLRQAQALMRRTDRLRSLETIAAGFAHEIRNPLTSIKTFIQLAPERKHDSHFIDEFSRIVLEDVNRIERLIQEILDYARYMEPRLTDEDLNELVSSSLHFIQAKADSRGIKIEKELAPGLPRGMLDRQQIKQVLLNLLLNAMDAIGEKTGTLRVRTTRLKKPDGEVWNQIEIEDTGHGISAEHLDRIFDPFFTTKHASAVNEGTGLGLTIAHQIVREHRGEIQVQSREGIGTAFRITFPLNEGRT